VPVGRGGRPTRTEIYARLDRQIDELRTRLGGLPSPAEAADIWKGIWYEEAHHSTAIEGNTLVLKEVATLLADGRAVGDKELSEYMEVRGYANASEWVYGNGLSGFDWEHDQLLTIQEVRNVHHLAMSPIWTVAPHPHAERTEAPGSYRRHEVYAFPEGMKPVTFPLIETEMQAWVETVNKFEARQDGLAESLAATHVRFEQIHPFIDGNGRTGRLLLNLVLVRLGYPPAIIYKAQRAAYLCALRRADSGDCGALGEFIARAILDNLYKFIVPAVAGPARLVPLAALATAEVNGTALRAAAVRGVLQATKGSDGQWRSSRNWVDEYIKGRWQRRSG
jgi:hypothetical protein